MPLPSGVGLNRKQYLRKLAGGRSLYGAGSKQVKNIRSTYHGSQSPKPAAPASASIPATPTGQMPWDARYESTRNSVNRNLANADTGYAESEAGINREFFDPTNPYNRAKLLQESYQRSARSANVGMAARGQLYSGSFQNAQDASLQNYQRGQHDLQGDYNNAVQDLIRRRQQARDEGSDTLASAENDRLDAAYANRPEDPGAPAPVKAGPRLGPKGKKVPGSGPPPGPNYRWNYDAHRWVKA